MAYYLMYCSGLRSLNVGHFFPPSFGNLKFAADGVGLRGGGKHLGFRPSFPVTYFAYIPNPVFQSVLISVKSPYHLDVCHGKTRVNLHRVQSANTRDSERQMI